MNVQTVHKNTNYLKQGLWEYVMRKSGPTSATSVNDSSYPVDVCLNAKPITSQPSHASPKTTSSTSIVLPPILPTIDDHNTQRSKVQSSDSIGNEMTHFKPIRFWPISEKHPATDNVLKVPTVRYKDATSEIYTPAKSCFHPEAPLKVRNSAFCLVAPLAVGSQQENKLVAVKRSIPTSLPSNGSNQSYSVQSGTKSKKQKLMCNIALDKTNRERILMQEKSDFELAKMLKEFDEEAQSTSSNNGTDRKNRKPAKGKSAPTKRGAATSLSSNSTATTSDVAENHEHNGLNGESLRTRRYFLRNRIKADQSDSNRANSNAKTVRVPNKATASSRLKKRHR